MRTTERERFILAIQNIPKHAFCGGLRLYYLNVKPFQLLNAPRKKYQSVPNQWSPIAQSFAVTMPAFSKIKIHFTTSNANGNLFFP